MTKLLRRRHGRDTIHGIVIISRAALTQYCKSFHEFCGNTVTVWLCLQTTILHLRVRTNNSKQNMPAIAGYLLYRGSRPQIGPMEDTPLCYAEEACHCNAWSHVHGVEIEDSPRPPEDPEQEKATADAELVGAEEMAPAGPRRHAVGSSGKNAANLDHHTGQSARATPESRQHAGPDSDGRAPATVSGSAWQSAGGAHNTSGFSITQVASRTTMHGSLPRTPSPGMVPRGLRHLHRHSLCLDDALKLLSTPALAPGEALQAAQDIANLATHSQVRAKLASTAVLDALLAAIQLHRREASMHIFTALARTAAESALAERLAVHSSLISTLLEAAESPPRSTSVSAARVLALCTRALSMESMYAARLLTVLKTLLQVEHTEVQVDVLRALGSICTTPHGVRAMSQKDVWAAIHGEHACAACALSPPPFGHYAPAI
jgi:hypothetical protein